MCKILLQKLTVFCGDDGDSQYGRMVKDTESLAISPQYAKDIQPVVWIFTESL
jgi:hypothetical protein